MSNNLLKLIAGSLISVFFQSTQANDVTICEPGSEISEFGAFQENSVAALASARPIYDDGCTNGGALSRGVGVERAQPYYLESGGFARFLCVEQFGSFDNICLLDTDGTGRGRRPFEFSGHHDIYFNQPGVHYIGTGTRNCNGFSCSDRIGLNDAVSVAPRGGWNLRLTASKTRVKVGEKIRFTATYNHANSKNCCEVEWDFDDRTGFNRPNTNGRSIEEKTYSKPGTYYVNTQITRGRSQLFQRLADNVDLLDRVSLRV